MKKYTLGFLLTISCLIYACQSSNKEDSKEKQEDVLPKETGHEETRFSPEIIYYNQGFFGNGTTPEYISMKPIWTTCDPQTEKPYTTQVYICSYNMGPHYPNLLPDTPYIHVNDMPLDDTNFTPLYSEIDSLKKYGVKVLMMLGGAGANYPHGDEQGVDGFGYKYNNNTWGVLWPSETEGIQLYGNTTMDSLYYSMVLNTLTTYQFDGIGLDFETRDVKLEQVVELIQNLKKDYQTAMGRELFVSLTPVANGLCTGDGIGGYQTIYSEMGGEIDGFNGQFYNGFGTVTTDSTGVSFSPGYVDVINATWNYQQQSYSFPAKEVILGAEISSLDSDSYQEYRSTGSSLAMKYPHFGGVFAWTYTDIIPGQTTVSAKWAEDMYKAIHQ